MTNWTQVITNLMLISGGSVVLVKFIDAVAKYFDKKKQKGLTDAVAEMRRDLEEVKKNSSDNRTWIRKLEDDLDYLMRLLLDKSLKK